MLRLGLCCKFYKEPIKFKTTTVKYISSLDAKTRLTKLSSLCLENANSLLAAIKYCNRNLIGCFRITSEFFPLKTHPKYGYSIQQLPDAQKIINILFECKRFASENNIRLTFHPDQFVILTSQNSKILENSIKELEYHAELSEFVGADVINIHAGGSYNDKQLALKNLGNVILNLSKEIRSRLTLENDDRVYTPKDLLPFCIKYKVPFVYDVHHHRCLSDNLTVEEVTTLAIKTWNREPLFHISSLKKLKNKKGCFHSKYINVKDFPSEWRKLNITVEVEAKAKELAVKKLYRDLKLQKG